MNYFRARSLSFLGLRVIELEIECVQSRRLPYVQIIGASPSAAGEQRERVVAAIDSSGFRLPGRRLTLRYSPHAHGLSLENFDAAVALALLGSAKVFPAREDYPFVAIGGLALDGSLRPASERAALGTWLRSAERPPLLLPFEESACLAPAQAGGGFRTLQEMVEFLRGDRRLGPRAELRAPAPAKLAAPAALRAPELRLAALAAAGGHHLLVVDAAPELSAALAAAARAMLGADANAAPPLRSFREVQAARLLRHDRKQATWGELSLSHGGVLCLREARFQHASLQPLYEAMQEGSLRSFHAGRPLVCPAEVLVLAEAAPCECGGRSASRRACGCRPALKEKRLAQLAAAPFDLRYMAGAGAAVGIGVDAESKAGASVAPPLTLPATAVRAARARAVEQRGKPNGRLRFGEALGAKPWAAEARAWLGVGDRKLGAAEVLARVALTVSDLREGEEVSREDVLEAWHHVAGLSFGAAPGASGSGRREARASWPAVNSRAIP